MMPFAGRVIPSLFRKLASATFSEVGEPRGVEDDLEKLRQTLGALLHDAERRNADEHLSAVLLRELEGLALDTEDVADEFEYDELRRRVENGGGGTAGGGKVSGRALPPHATHAVSFPKEILHRIDDIWGRLDEISRSMRDLDLSEVLDAGRDRRGSSSSRSMETGSFLPETDIFGRLEQKNRLRELLLGTTGDAPPSPPSSGVHPAGLSVVSIVGMAGLGKTTLARWIYSIKEVEECFHLRVWVSVSHDFNLQRVTRQILEHVVPNQSDLQNVDSLDVLQQILVEGLKGKHLLLVLDDVWEVDLGKWCEFFAPLVHGKNSSKVLITTRHAKVTDVLQSVKIELGGLPFKDCWSVFRRHAFPNGDSDKHPILDSLGEEIVKKLKGIPLAARTIGGLLRFESMEENWRDVLQSDLWEMEEGDGGIIPALRVSYEYLPPHLKRCFAYFSVFPKGHRFGMLELVQLWMAQGYVQPQESKAVEDVGRDCLSELFSRSLIQFDNDRYVMHDLLHDLGQLILQHDFYEIKGDDVQRIPEDAHFKRHWLLSYEKSTTGELKVLYEFRRLRTFLLKLSLSTNKVLFQIPINFSDTVACLRALDLSYCGIETLPETIDCLRHLRFLSLRGTPIKCLPESLCFLYKLQTLLLQECNQLSILPERMSNLISLHYLEAKPELVAKIIGIGKLSNLQNLLVFCVSEENGNEIGGLRNMNKLRGKLCIQNLQGVGSREEVIQAALERKQYLETLEMEWAADRVDIDSYFDESILGGLQLPPNLNELILKSYAGLNLPSWMSRSLISSLKLVHLHRCIDLNHLPTTLKDLTLLDVRINALPASLSRLPLQKLVLGQIPELRELPLLPTSLKELTIEFAGLESLPEFDQSHKLAVVTPAGCGEDEDSDSGKPSLSILKIHGCPHLRTLQGGLLQHHLRHLKVLSIKDCEELVSWPEGGGFLATLYSLEELSIEDCSKVEPLPEGSKLPTSLKKLTMKDCLGIPNESLFNQLHSLHCDNVSMGKFYFSLEYCSYEMLQHLKTVDKFAVNFLRTSAITSPLVVASYDTDRTSSWSFQGAQVTLVIMTPAADGDSNAATEDDGSSQLLSMCLGGHAWVFSIRNLTLDSVPDRALFGISIPRTAAPSKKRTMKEGDDMAQLHHQPAYFANLEKLEIWRCKEMRALATETMLCHMTSLKEVIINDCPKLTLSSLQEGIQRLPSLEALYVYKCPQLLEPLPSALPAQPPSSPASSTLLRYLSTDDVRLPIRLLINKNAHHGHSGSNTNELPLHDHLLGFLRYLRIDGCGCTSIAGEVEAGLRALSPFLQSLAFFHCPNLCSLPVDLRFLLPNLRALWIESCPAIHCLPERGLPASLQLLRINLCPALAEWCRLLPPAIGHIPLIAIDQEFVQGSYPRFLELRGNWDFIF